MTFNQPAPFVLSISNYYCHLIESYIDRHKAHIEYTLIKNIAKSNTNHVIITLIRIKHFEQEWKTIGFGNHTDEQVSRQISQIVAGKNIEAESKDYANHFREDYMKRYVPIQPEPYEENTFTGRQTESIKINPVIKKLKTTLANEAICPLFRSVTYPSQHTKCNLNISPQKQTHESYINPNETIQTNNTNSRINDQLDSKDLIYIIAPLRPGKSSLISQIIYNRECDSKSSGFKILVISPFPGDLNRQSEHINEILKSINRDRVIVSTVCVFNYGNLFLNDTIDISTDRITFTTTNSFLEAFSNYNDGKWTTFFQNFTHIIFDDVNNFLIFFIFRSNYSIILKSYFSA